MPTCLPSRQNALWLRVVVWAVATWAALHLGGCASVYRVDSQVDTHAAWAPAPVPRAGDTYRIERLPSQTSGNAAVDANALGQLLVPELARYGLAQALGPAATNATWVVQVRRRETVKPHAPWVADPWGWSVGMGASRGNVGIGVNMPLWNMGPPYYEREVEVQIRYHDSTRVAYESRARHDGPWQGTPALWSAMLEAALLGFPTPPDGPRAVNKDLPR